MLCAVLALVLYLLSAFVFFRIDKIEVIGVKDSEGNILPASTYYTEEEIIRVSGVETGDSLVRVSKSAVRDSIEKLLPYIGNVKVQRRYPSTLRLVTEDTHAVYGADAGGGLTLLDENYKVLGVSEKRPKGCMKITGLSFESAEKIWICDIRFICRVVKSLIKNSLQFCYKGFFSAHQPRQSLNVMRNIECIVPCTAFMKARDRLEILSLTRIERFQERTVLQERPQCAEIRAVIVAVA